MKKSKPVNNTDNVDLIRDKRFKELELQLIKARAEVRDLEARVKSFDLQSQASLRQTIETKSLSESLVENSRLPLLVLDEMLHIRMVSPPFYKVFNLEEQNLEGTSIFDFDEGRWNIPALRTLLEINLPKKKTIENFEIKHSFKNYGERTIIFNVREVAEDDFAKSIILSIEDVSGIKKADEANAMLAAIVQSSEDAIVSKTLKGIITSWNAAAEKLFGYTSDEMIGEHILKIIPSDRVDEEPEIIRKIQNGETIAHFETQRLAKGNKLIDISLTISPIKNKNGQIIGASKIAREITDQIEIRRKVEESEKRFHSLIYSSPSAIGILDGEDFVIRTANAPIIKIWGKSEDIIGKKYFEALPELAEQGYKEIFENVFRTGEPYYAVERPLRILQNGEYTLKYYSFILYPQYDLNDNVNGIGIIGSEVTEQALQNKRIKESEERFRTLTETLPQLIWVTDAQGNREFASSRWEAYSGIDPAAENAWKDVLHPEEFDRISAAWANCLVTGVIYKSEVRLKNRRGEYRWHSVEAERVLNSENKIIKWIGAFTDIHDQKVKEEKKDEFMNIASHEMKTPLTTAKAYLQMLEISLEDSHQEAKLFANKASYAVERLNELIAELLDVSKIQFGKLNYTMTTFNFNTMIDRTVENIQLTSPATTIVKSGSAKDWYTGDENRLQQVVINLLSNAIKYSPDADKVYITIAQDSDNLKVSVRDTGIGIASENLSRIFEKYHRVEEHAVQFQGMGVGLFISYEIIQRHGGRLWVESEVGEGSTFFFTLPVNGLTQK